MKPPKMARSYGVGLHTHLAENSEDIDYSLASFGMRPGDYAEAVGWVGADVWHAHCVQLDASEIDLFARTATGVAHCPCSNMRLASGIAPVRQMLDAGVKVGLGVDGSASNDSGHMLNEARQAMLLQRVMHARQSAVMPFRCHDRARNTWRWQRAAARRFLGAMILAFWHRAMRQILRPLTAAALILPVRRGIRWHRFQNGN